MIQVSHLSVAFDGPEVVKDVSFEIKNGEILGVVGESGSGKSVTALTLMGLLAETGHVTAGEIRFDDTVLLEEGKPRSEVLYREYQGRRMSMVFQEPMTSLNPTMKVGQQVEEILILHEDCAQEQGGMQGSNDGKMKRQDPAGEVQRVAMHAGVSGFLAARKERALRRKERVLEALRSVGLQDVERVYDCYPHQLSGGMRQRVMIAMAVILHPDLIVADEPTTALDVTVQNQIIKLLKKINQEQKNSLLFITHDLNLARRICDRILVMQNGCIVEEGGTEEIFQNPKGEYTQKLISAVPSRMGRTQSRYSIEREQNPEKMHKALVQVRDLSVYYRENANSLFGRARKKCVVQGADFEVYEGEILGLIGESGCGKTTLSKAILGLNPLISGSVTHCSNAPQMVFQDPYSSLNPSKTVGWLLEEPLYAQGILNPSKAMTKEERKAAAMEMLRMVGLKEKYYDRKPSQLSGGQRQRISIGQALITRPGLVIADEPVSALDVTIQAQILELIRKLQDELGTAYLFISHDINVIYQVSDRIMVMKDGKILEIGETEEIFTNPQNPYTRELFQV